MASRDQQATLGPASAGAVEESALPTNEALGRKVRAATVDTLSAERSAEAAFARLQEDASVRREVAGLHCKKYCSHCCYKTVSVTPAEVVHIAAYIRADFSAKALARLKARLRDLERKTQGMTPEQRGRARLPCALLVGRLCTAHPARPASCRGFNSRDVSACERSLKHRGEEIPVYAPQYRLFVQVHLA